jgi:uncharacterized protein YdhG (YjbR/CyaY superfamily)
LSNISPSTPLKFRSACKHYTTLCKDAEERMAYGMPAFKTTENIVYFAGYKNHVGLYPTPLPIEHFADQLTPYKTSKGAIQFPHTQKLPVALIKKIVQFRLKEMRK